MRSNIAKTHSVALFATHCLTGIDFAIVQSEATAETTLADVRAMIEGRVDDSKYAPAGQRIPGKIDELKHFVDMFNGCFTRDVRTVFARADAARLPDFHGMRATSWHELAFNMIHSRYSFLRRFLMESEWSNTIRECGGSGEAVLGRLKVEYSSRFIRGATGGLREWLLEREVEIRNWLVKEGLFIDEATIQGDGTRDAGGHLGVTIDASGTVLHKAAKSLSHAEKINRRDERLVEIFREHGLANQVEQWARLAELANADSEIVALGLRELTRENARRIVTARKPRRRTA